jgi:hypothetical protein
MAQRKYLIVFLFPVLTYANPWIPETGKWSYALELSKEIKPKTSINEFSAYLEIQKNIILLEKKLAEIKTKISLLQDNARNNENRNRLEIYKNHRKNEIEKLQARLKDLEEYLYLDYKLGSFSHKIEYGHRDNISFGIGGNFSKSKYSQSNRAMIFGKYKIYDKNRKILSIKTYAHIEEGTVYPGMDIIWGGSKKTKKLDSFFYSSFGISHGSIYNYETMVGTRFKNDYLILVQAIGRMEKHTTKLYQNLLRKQYKIAHEIQNNHTKFAISFGYYQDISISAKRPLGSGYIIGIWGEI